MNGPGFGAAAAVAALVVLVLDGPILLVAHGAAKEQLGRNHAAGIRLPSFMRSDEAWRAGHEAAYRPILAGCVVSAVLAVVSIALGATTAPYVVVLGLAIGAALVGLAVGTVRGHRAATAVTEATGRP